MQLIIEGSIVMGYSADFAEYFNNRTEITVPEGVTEIGECAFASSFNFTKIHLPDSVVSIQKNAFYGCGALNEINIPENTEKIYGGAFKWCTALKKIHIPAKISHIGENAFDSCDDLTAIHVDADNPFFCDVNGVLYDKDQKTLLRFPPGKEMDTYSISEGVEAIRADALDRCQMNVINLPSTLRFIGENAFYGCDQLGDIHVSSKNQYFYADDGVLFVKETRTLLCYPAGKQQSEYTIPNGTKGIGADAFLQPLKKHEDTLQTIRIPASVESIRGSAFDALTELCAIDVSEDNPCFCDAYGVLYTKDMTEIVRFPIDYPCSSYTLPESVKRIGDCAFRSCGDLDEIEFPDGLEEIGAYGLSCYDLKLRSLPESLVRIGKGAFVGLHRLIQLEIPVNVRQLSGKIVDECPLLSRIILHHRTDGIALEKDTFYGFGGEILYITDRMQLLLPSSVLEIDWYDDEQYYVLFFLTCTEESGKHSFYFSKVEKPYKSLLAVWAIVHLQEPLDLYVEYLQEDDGGIRMLIERQDYPNLAKVLEYPVITEGNIESLLQFAIDRRDTEATIQLLHYKKKKSDFLIRRRRFRCRTGIQWNRRSYGFFDQGR